MNQNDRNEELLERSAAALHKLDRYQRSRWRKFKAWWLRQKVNYRQWRQKRRKQK